ncbi:hypothetical protein [Ornithinibacillus contaminans]|uniref:hypothetical protein n=1 Tax=Ornithinibacillus contaminans TaxID=694055 RepID=UPI00064DE1D4|nr:hypothetical protein [Ornithinibacillus contaminans]
MGITFWTNTVWFILLGLTTIITLVVIFAKVKNRKTALAFYITMSGFAFSFEMVIMSYFKAYTYYPMLIPSSLSDDSVAGNLFSQFSVTATAMLIAVLKLKYYWYVIFILLYAGIEELFLSLGIYQHNWYRTWMTMTLLPIFFWITKHAYRICLTQLKGFLFYVYIYLGLVTLHQNTILWVLRITGLQTFSEGLLSEKEQSMITISFIYMILINVITILIYFTGIRWGRKLVVIALLYIAHFLAMVFDLIIYKEGWFWISTSISIWSVYFYTYLLDKLYGFRDEKR